MENAHFDSVMVIVTENGIVDRVQNLDEGMFHFTLMPLEKA